MLKGELPVESMNGILGFEFRDLDVLGCKNTPLRHKDVLAPIEDFIAITLNQKKQSSQNTLSYVCKQVDLAMSNNWTQHLEDSLTKLLRIFFAQRLEEFNG